jgi:hypothetical protein
MLASDTGGLVVSMLPSGTGGLAVSMLASGTQDRGFPGVKNPEHAFLRKGSKTVCPMPQICGMLKEPSNYVEVGLSGLNLTGHFSPIIPPFGNRGLSRHLVWSASGDEWSN